MTEVLNQATIDKLESDRLEYIEKTMADAAIYFAQTLADSKPAAYDDGSQHLPEDVFND